MNLIVKTILIGIGATFTMDVWAYLLRFFNIKSLDYRFLGRWIGNIPKGKFFHDKIFDTPPVRNELIIGWIAHYLIGISFAVLLVLVYGKGWLDEPTFYPALIIGVITIVAPLFVMQPAFGIGIASSKLPAPNTARFKSLCTHTIYGVGLYATALLVKHISMLLIS